MIIEKNQRSLEAMFFKSSRRSEACVLPYPHMVKLLNVPRSNHSTANLFHQTRQYNDEINRTPFRNSPFTNVLSHDTLVMGGFFKKQKKKIEIPHLLTCRLLTR
jgi:hypothetical protein